MEKLEALQTWPQRVANTLRSWIADYPVWWNELTIFQRAYPAVALGLYFSTLVALHGLRGDHISIGGSLLILYYLGRPGRAFLQFALPFFLTGIIYDSQRFYADYIRGPIHVTEPYAFDKMFFGIQTASGVLTPNEWWQLHTHWSLDLITGFAYLVFFAIFIVISAYFYFIVGTTGTRRMSAERVKEKAKRKVWAFLWLNLLGYSTYYWYAAAPPWYVAAHGLGPAKLDVQASSAGCARFDQLLGTHFFSEMYGRAADVFGAIPSLHVSYPLLTVLFAFQFGKLRRFSVFFYLLMCFSAVYLNHHYVLDILWGSTYALLMAWVTDQIFEWRAQRARYRLSA